MGQNYPVKKPCKLVLPDLVAALMRLCFQPLTPFAGTPVESEEGTTGWLLTLLLQIKRKVSRFGEAPGKFLRKELSNIKKKNVFLIKNGNYQ